MLKMKERNFSGDHFSYRLVRIVQLRNKFLKNKENIFIHTSLKSHNWAATLGVTYQTFHHFFSKIPHRMSFEKSLHHKGAIVVLRKTRNSEKLEKLVSKSLVS